MRCVSYMRGDSHWRDEYSGYHEQAREKNKSGPYYDLDGDLIAQQREHIKAYADELGWAVEEEYIDIEGTDAFERLKEDSISRKFDCLITDSFFRFAGTAGEAKVTLQHVFIPVGIRVAVAQDKFCSETMTKTETDFYFECKQKQHSHEGIWIAKQKEKAAGTAEGSDTPNNKRTHRKKGISIMGSQIHDAETGEVLRYNGQMGNGVYYRERDRDTVRWGVERAVVPRDEILDVVKRVLENEKAAALRAKEELDFDSAEMYTEKLLSPLQKRAAQLVNEIDRLYVMKMEHEKDTDKDSAEEDRRLAGIEVEFQEIMRKANQIKNAYSHRNPWIKLYASVDIPENLENWFIRRYISDVRIYGLEAGGTYTAQVSLKQEEYRSLMPDEWLPGLTFRLQNPAEAGVPDGREGGD